jgi:hypothetical protein
MRPATNSTPRQNRVRKSRRRQRRSPGPMPPGSNQPVSIYATSLIESQVKVAVSVSSDADTALGTPEDGDRPWLAGWLPWSIVVGAAVFVAVCSVSSHVWLSDTYMTLYAGRYIAQHGIPTLDPFTVAAHGHAWIDQEWLAHWLYFQAWRAGGATAVGCLSAFLIASAFGMLAAIMLRRGNDPLRTATWVSIAFFVCQANTAIRAQSMAYPLFVGALWIVLADEQRDRFDRRLWLSVPLLVMWGNVHGSALMGAGIIGGWMLIRAISTARQREWRQVEGYVAVAFAAAASVILVAPYSPGQVVHYYRSILSNPVIQQYIIEWMPATYGGESIIFTAMLAITLIVVGVAVGRRYRPSLALGLLTLLTAVAATQALRCQVWFAFPAAILISDVIRHIAPARRVDRRSTSRLPQLLATLAVFLIGVAAALAFAPGQATRAELFALFAGLIAGADALNRLTDADRNRMVKLGIPAAVGGAFLCAVVALAATPASELESSVGLTSLAATNAYAVAHPEVDVLGDDISGPALLWHYPKLAGRVGFDARLEIFPRPALAQFMHFVSMDDPAWLRASKGYDVLVVSRIEHPALAARISRLPGWHAIQSNAGRGVVVVR